MATTQSAEKSTDFSSYDSRFAGMTYEQQAEEAVRIAVNQLIASTEFKKPRMARIRKYWDLYNGKVPKKARQMFNVPIPVFPGMIDTLNALYDSPIQVSFSEGDPADHFKVKKINGMFRMETLNTAGNSKWESKFRMARKHGIMQGRGIVRYTVESDPEYKSDLSNVPLENFHFQPKGGGDLEKHLFAGEEGVKRTKSQLVTKAKNGEYNQEQVKKLLDTCSNNEYLPDSSNDIGEKLSRFKPLGLDPNNHNYVGEEVYNLAEWIMTINGERYYLLFHPWSKTWLRFQKWKEIDSSGLYPWDSYATHEDDENFLSKGYADDLYVASDAIVSMFNQELTNREKRNNGSRAYDRDMFKDVRKLDEAMHRPDGLVPADTQGGVKRIAEGVYEFKVAELGGTVNLIDWITGTLGRNTGASELSMGEVQDASKKASVTFAEQKSIAKRVSWASASFQEMIASIGKKYIWGLKDHMPAKMAIKILGEHGYDWQDITRLDLDTTKDVDVVITSSDKQVLENEMRADRRRKALESIAADPTLAGRANPQWRLEQILRIGEFDDVEIAVAMDSKNYSDRNALAKASAAIQEILLGKKPEIWFGANRAFYTYITNYAADKRSTLGDNFAKLIDYATEHVEIIKDNIDRQIREEEILALSQPLVPELSVPPERKSEAINPGVSGGVSKAMQIAESVV